jgi:hypothetical protein
MSDRVLKQLVGALAVVVAIWAVTSLFSNDSGSIAASGEITEFFDGLDAQTVSVVRIDGPDGVAELVRTSDGWTSNGFRADRNAITELIGVVEGAQIGELVATNPSNHDRMGVSADSAITVVFEGDGEPRTILIGKRGRAFATSYVRLPGEDEVFLLDGDLQAQVIRRLESWRDRTMIALDTSIVSTLTVERGGAEYTVRRADDAWTLEDGGVADQRAVDAVLSELSGLVATGFLAEGDSISSFEPEGVLRAYSESGDELAEVSMGSGSGDRWARTTADDYIYRVSSFRIGRVLPTREDLEPGS